MLRLVILAGLVAYATAATVCGSAPCQADICEGRGFTPGSSGKPDCSKTTNGNYRNNNDPTKYWKCAGNGEATSESCQTDYLFDDVTKVCVCRNEWTWTQPCDPQYPLPDDIPCPASCKA